jgi:catechol 2,3-dioxygenase-like lactoylglutathione lyase family enzyme
MTPRTSATTIRLAGAVALSMAVAAVSQHGPIVAAQTSTATSLPTPAFHHLHLNSINPDAAIDFYTRQFPSTSRATFAGQPALKSPTDVWVLFTKVDTPPPTQPQTAFWHFGWVVTDVHKSADAYIQHGVTLLPLYAEEGGATVITSADTWPGTGGVLGLTRAGIADAKARGVKPTFGAGFAYLRGPDDAMIEYQGNMPAERFNHIHMYMEQPFCAQLWYQQHLNMPAGGRGGTATPVRTEANCRVERGQDKSWPALDSDGMYRSPSLTSMAFSGVSLFAYMNQTATPLGGTRGHLMDHYGLRVAELDPWIAKLRAEGVRFLEEPYKVGSYRAVMIEGPSREAIELIELSS